MYWSAGAIFFRFLLGLVLLVLPAGAYQEISDNTLRGIPRPSNDFDIHTGAILSPILRTRVPGTPGSAAVLDHFVGFFRTTLPNWKVEFQNSTSKTPVHGDKEIPFVNFIASRDPPWVAAGDVGRLNLVAHYDSKYTPEGFIGAIDSAAPCAMIMHAMRNIDEALTKKWNALQAKRDAEALRMERKGIQVLFLDGEEAFKTWSSKDSLYGARSLASQWDEQVNPALSTYRTPLASISLFVLLDLLGSKDPTIQSFFPTTHWAYQKIAVLETRFRELKQFKSSPKSPWFRDSSKSEYDLGKYMVGDDHVPFLTRGVEILHLIDMSSWGFPSVWHTLNDDGEHLDAPTTEDWSLLITAFAAEWMELEGYMETSSGNQGEPTVKQRSGSCKTEL